MRFVAITPYLALIREAHRLVLSWTRFEGQRVDAFTATLTREDVAACGAALDRHQAWSSKDGLARLRLGDDASVTLGLRKAGEAEFVDLALDGEARRRLREGIAQFTR